MANWLDKYEQGGLVLKKRLRITMANKVTTMMQKHL